MRADALNLTSSALTRVEAHLPLVYATARRVARRLPPRIDREDLVGVGVLGLMEADARWRPDGGASFKTFAERRIRGAMLDEMRRGAPLSRRDLERLEAGERVRTYVGEDDLAAIAVPPAPPRDVFLEARVRAAIRTLPPRERFVVVALHWAGRVQREVGLVLGVTEGRVNQLYHRALGRLRNALTNATHPRRP